MNTIITVVGRELEFESDLTKNLEKAMDGFGGYQIYAAATAPFIGDIVFIDGLIESVGQVIRDVEKSGRIAVLISFDSSKIPSTFSEGITTEVVSFPFRGVDIYQLFQRLEQPLLWNEVKSSHDNQLQLIEKLRNDLNVIESLVEQNAPAKPFKGGNFDVRYLAGRGPGGNYFDVKKTKGGYDFFLVETNDYGLSTEILMLIETSMEYEAREQLTHIAQEISKSNDASKLASILIARFDRTRKVLSIASLGKNVVIQLNPKTHSKASFMGVSQWACGLPLEGLKEQSWELSPGDRLVFLTEGFIEILGGSTPLLDLVDRFKSKAPVSLLNEVVYRAKSRNYPSGLPPKDCTAMVFDLNSNVLKLAS